ncbi:MAG: hypothetical protein V1792_12855 [Pseudomonadota bacterium]
MYWKLSGGRIGVLTIPLYTMGDEQVFSITLTTESGEEEQSAYLFTTQSSCVGLLQAKRASDTAYMAIMGPFDANCFLGHIPSESEVELDFLVHLPEGSAEGYAIIRVMVGDGAVARLPNPYFATDWPELWHEEWLDLWHGDH